MPSVVVLKREQGRTVEARSQDLAQRAIRSCVAQWRWREPDVLAEQPWPARELGVLSKHSRVWMQLRKRPLDILRATALEMPVSEEQKPALLTLIEELCQQIADPATSRIVQPWVAPHRVTLSSCQGLLRLSFRAMYLDQRRAEALPASVTASAIWTATDLEEGARTAEAAWSGEKPLPNLRLTRKPRGTEEGKASNASHNGNDNDKDDACAALVDLGGLLHPPGAFEDVRFPLLLVQVPNGVWAQAERLCRRIAMDPRLPIDVCPAGSMCPAGAASLFCVALVTQCVDVTCAWMRRAFGGVFRQRVVILCCEENRDRVPPPPADVPFRVWHLGVKEEAIDDDTLWGILLARALPWLAHGVAAYLERRVVD